MRDCSRHWFPPLAMRWGSIKRPRRSSRMTTMHFSGPSWSGRLGYVALKLGPYAGHFSAGSKLIFVAVFVFGLILLRMGWQGTRGKQRDPIGAVMSIVVPAVGYYVIVNYLPGLLHIFWCRAAAAGLITAYAVRFWLDIRSPGGKALQMVNADIAKNEFSWD